MKDSKNILYKIQKENIINNNSSVNINISFKNSLTIINKDGIVCNYNNLNNSGLIKISRYVRIPLNILEQYVIISDYTIGQYYIFSKDNQLYLAQYGLDKQSYIKTMNKEEIEDYFNDNNKLSYYIMPSGRMSNISNYTKLLRSEDEIKADIQKQLMLSFKMLKEELYNFGNIDLIIKNPLLFRYLQHQVSNPDFSDDFKFNIPLTTNMTPLFVKLNDDKISIENITINYVNKNNYQMKIDEYISRDYVDLKNLDNPKIKTLKKSL